MVASMNSMQPASHHSFSFFLMTFCMMDFAEKEGLLIVYIVTYSTIIIIIMVIIIIVIISHPCCPT